MSATRFQPVRQCIYCNATDRLGDEHIIPAGLGGEWILPEASCRKCEGIISSIEGACLRGVMHGARLRLGLRKRRRKGSPPRLWAHIARDGIEMLHAFELPDHPTLLTLPFLAMPTILGGTGGIAGVWQYRFNLNWAKLRNDRINQVTQVLDVYRFSQLLSKIGHAYAAAELGVGGFSPILLEAIKTGLTNPFKLVGGSPIVMPTSESLHTIELLPNNGSSYVVIAIRLFARYGGPIYHVVAGVLEPTTSAVS